MRELNDVRVLRAALEDARNYTLRLYSHLSPAQLAAPYLRIVNPPLWEMAHVGWFQEYWCLRYRLHREPVPSRLRGSDPILNSAIIPHPERWKLPQLTAGTVLDYLRREFDDTLQALDRSDDEQRYFFKLALYHEDMHGEAMLMTLQTLGLPAPKPLHEPCARPALQATAAGDIAFDGGEFGMGSRPGKDFVFDNEQAAHEVEVAPFILSAGTVTNGEYLGFVSADGYQRAELWSTEGWRWRAQNGTEAPRYWRKDAGKWLVRRFDSWEALDPDDPVIHVNAYEAEAYCRYTGRRLPTEAEWEFAARAALEPGCDRFPWGDAPALPGTVNFDGSYSRPIHSGALARTDSRCGLQQMLGNVWEWTASAFEPYPGFAPGPYLEYSAPWFHTHRSLRGGCFATRSRLVHNRWRNFYTPERNDIFAGFRTAGSL